MSFEPLDTGLIARRLRAEVPANDLHSVGGVADFAAVQLLSGFRTPSAYVIFAEEEDTKKVPASPGQYSVEAAAQFGVVLALRNYGDQTGDKIAPEARRLIGLVRAALIGFKPGKGIGAIGWVSGKVLDYDASVLLFGDVFRVVHTMHREGPTP